MRRRNSVKRVRKTSESNIPILNVSSVRIHQSERNTIILDCEAMPEGVCSPFQGVFILKIPNLASYPKSHEVFLSSVYGQEKQIYLDTDNAITVNDLLGYVYYMLIYDTDEERLYMVR